MSVDWLVEKSGFCVGEGMMVHASIQNDSKHDILSSTVSIIMVGVVVHNMLMQGFKNCIQNFSVFEVFLLIVNENRLFNISNFSPKQHDEMLNFTAWPSSTSQIVEHKWNKRRLIDRSRLACLQRSAMASDDVIVWNHSITIPTCPPSSFDLSRIIRVSYEAEVSELV